MGSNDITREKILSTHLVMSRGPLKLWCVRYQRDTGGHGTRYFLEDARTSTRTAVTYKAGRAAVEAINQLKLF